MDESFYWLGFSVFPGVGPKKFALLCSRFGSAKNAWSAQEIQLAEVVGQKLAAQFILFRTSFSPADYAEKLEKKHVRFLTLIDTHYPVLLKKIANPPFVLYVRGNTTILHQDTHYIGVVGTRKVTTYGREVTEMVTRDLVGVGAVIVSGLAMGVDAVAHKTTIDNGGKTIAVLGCGVDCCSPRENEGLYDRILEQGSVIVSEFPLGTSPSVGSFPSRNRIIAGLSHR